MPGLSPRSPVMTDGPVLVTVVEPSTAKFWAVPRDGAVCATAALKRHNVRSKVRNATGPKLAKLL